MAVAIAANSCNPGYDNARKVWNGMHDKHPALIARCANHADIQQAVTFARERDMLLAVRGGGHSWPGKSVCDGGMMLDLAEMQTVNVDTAARRAIAQGFKKLEPFTGGFYDNIEFDNDSREARNYGPAHKRLAQIKAKYDPTNQFRLNRNITPAT